MLQLIKQFYPLFIQCVGLFLFVYTLMYPNDFPSKRMMIMIRVMAFVILIIGSILIQFRKLGYI